MKYAFLLVVAAVAAASPAVVTVVDASNAAATLLDLPGKVASGVRRHLNFNGILGSPTRPTNSESHTAYEKIMGHPVFQVTTAWGSAYMNMEKLTLEDAQSNSNSASENKMLASGVDDASSFGSEDSQYRTISLYYMDPDDAIGAHAEFKQMDGMTDADVRVTAVSLAKALRSASHLGRGLLTGQPIDAHKGTVLPTKEGGSLRHKIMPPKKQLFYAARCHGRERIGLFGKGDDSGDRDSRYEHAVAAVIGNAALAYRNSQRKQAIRDRKLAYRPKSQLEADYAHMDGSLGIPVFYAPGMERRKNRIKSLVSGSQRKEIPLFFNYEDLQMAWQKTKPLGVGADKDKYLPNEPLGVEVFNLWDVLTSMEKEQSRREPKIEALKPQDKVLKAITHPFVNRWKNIKGGSSSSSSSSKSGSSVIEDNLLDGLVFIPSSDACTYKEKITARGNGQARARPMRESSYVAADRKIFFF